MIAIDALLIVCAAALLVPVLVFFVQVLLAVLMKVKMRAITVRRPSVAVIVPAHNEQVMIEPTLKSILPQMEEADRLLVVADNCSDNTASIASALGAEVVERFNQRERGKGYALDFGVRHCVENPPEVVIIVDADCQIGTDVINQLAGTCVESGRPVQSLYLMKSPPGAGLKTRIAEFAWTVKNLVRPSGFASLGLPCQLMGTGMAFLWKDISTVNLASGHIVEDLKLGIDFCRSGKPPLFLPAVTVTSAFPANPEGLTNQRTRWEHGHLGVIFSEAPALFVEAVVRGNINLLALVLDLIVPPLALLMLLTLAVFCVSSLSFFFGGSMLPLWLSAAALSLLGVAVLVAWAVYGRQVISLASLCYAPVYAIFKIPLYLKFLVKRQVDWVRSKRDDL